MTRVLSVAVSAALLASACGAALADQQPAPQSVAPTSAEVCLTNACAEAIAPLAPAPAPTVPTGPTGPPPGAPPNSFIAKFNGNSPTLVHGRILSVEWGDPNSYFKVTDETGKVYKVEGGAGSALTPDQRASMESALGKEVTVRGYNAWDTSCQDGCLMNGRDVTYKGGGPILGPPPGSVAR